MRTSGKRIRLDPEPRELGGLQLLDDGTAAAFIPNEYRDPKSRWFVPPAERYVSHMATCPANDRTADATNARFMDACARRLRLIEEVA